MTEPNKGLSRFAVSNGTETVPHQSTVLSPKIVCVGRGPASGSAPEPRDNSDADRKLSCPECTQTMVGYPYGGPGNVNLDSCERCSVIWLDNRELWRIVLAPDHYPVYSSHDGVSN